MAQYKTDVEAGRELSRLLQEKARELKPIYDSKNPKDQTRAEKLKAEIGGIQNSLMMLSDTGAFGGGIAKGVSSLLTAIPDIGVGVKNLFSKEQTGSASDWLTPGIGNISQEHAGLYGIGKGLGSSLGFGKGLTALNTGASAVDEKLLNGSPILQTALGGGLLLKGGAQATLNALKNHQVQKLLSQLPVEDATALQQYMIKGQSSTDPIIAGKILELRNNPKYADLFNILEKKATEATTAGVRAETNPSYNPKDVGAGIYEAMSGKIAGLKEAIKTGASGAYNKAHEYAGAEPIVPTTNTVTALDSLIKQYSGSKLTDSEATVKFLEKLKGSLLEGTTVGQPELLKEGVSAKFTVPQLQAWLTDFGSKAKGGESLITDVSIGTQKQIASQIFGGVKDDLKSLLRSPDQNERAIGNLLISASNKTRKAAEDYNGFISQGLPSILQNKPLSAIDSEEMLKLVKGLSNDQRATLATTLEHTAPEDLNRVRQVMFDDFVQSARNSEGKIDLQSLTAKYNKMSETEKKSTAFMLGDKAGDFESRMKDATQFFKYNEVASGAVKSDKVNPAEIQQAAYAASAGNYGLAKVGGLMANLWNHVKGGVTDEQALNLLMSPETKGLLREAVTNPNSVKTLDRLDKSLFYKDAGTTAGSGARVIVQGMDGTTPSVPVREPWDVGPAPIGTTPQQEPVNAPTEPSKAPWDVGPAKQISKADIEAQIRAEAEKQGLGQHADLLVKQARQESGFNPYATSKVGAAGVFQHMPKTAQELGIDPYDPEQSIKGGVQYMGQLLKKYNGNKAQALAAYNWGMGNVDRQGLNNMPTETQDYLRNILGA